MKIEDLSYITEVIEVNANNLNGGYIVYEDIALANAGWYEFAGDSLETIGADGSLMYGAEEYWLGSI
jgi:hypothetical protein